MPNRWRSIVERLLPYYSAEREALRDARTEAIRQRSIRERVNAEPIAAAYRNGDQAVRRDR